MVLSVQDERVLRLLAGGTMSPGKVAKTLRISRTTLYKHIRRLVKSGVLHWKRRGGYILTHGGGYNPDLFWSLHRVSVWFEWPLGVDRRRFFGCLGRVLSGKRVSSRRVGLNNGVFYEEFFVEGKYAAFAFEDGVRVWCPEFRGGDPNEPFVLLADFVGWLRVELNRLFGSGFFGEGCRVRLVSGELARVSDGVAEFITRESDRVFVWKDGVLRWLFDRSHGPGESEFVSVRNLVGDANLWEGWCRDFLSEGERGGLLLPSQIRGEFGVVSDMISRLVKSDAELALRIKRLDEKFGKGIL